MCVGQQIFADLTTKELWLEPMRCRYNIRSAFALLCVFLVAWCQSQATPKCPTRKISKKVDRQAVEELQRAINEGHDPWRKDPKAAAALEIMDFDPAYKGTRLSIYSLPLRAVVVKQTVAVFVHDTPDGKRSYRMTLERFRWLLPLAKNWDEMVWTPTRIEVSECASASSKKQEK